MKPDSEIRTADGGARGRFERIYQTLRTRICLLDYAPGSRLREEDLADEFGVSRTPVRRVLVKLEAEGLLRSVHGVGTIVTDIDVNDLAQVYELRVELAELVGKLSPAVVDEALIARFRDIRARCDRMAAAGDPREFSRINMEFSTSSRRSPTTSRCARSTNGSTTRPPASG